MSLMEAPPLTRQHANQFTSKWTVECAARLIELWPNPDLDSMQIAGMLGVEFNHPWSHHAIEYRARLLGLPPKLQSTWWTAERISLLKKLWDDGDSAGTIAKRFGITRNAVCGKVDRLKLTKRKSRVLAWQSRSRPALVGNQPPPRQKKSEVPFLGLTLMQLGPDQCLYSPGDVGLLFCGQPKKEKSSYCPHCHKIAYAEPRR